MQTADGSKMQTMLQNRPRPRSRPRAQSALIFRSTLQSAFIITISTIPRVAFINCKEPVQSQVAVPSFICTYLCTDKEDNFTY